jgi:S-adenosylmethionine synthetase
VDSVIRPVCGSLFDDGTLTYINAAGTFTLGGPEADTGVTGRKVISDSYGGMARNGGGAISGKDPTKVDRSGAYVARWIAKNIVAAGLARRCEIQLSYAIGEPQPISIFIDAFGTAQRDESALERLVRTVFPLTPCEIIKALDLTRPIYRKTSVFGHFGRQDPDFTWERTDMVDVLKKEAGL